MLKILLWLKYLRKKKIIFLSIAAVTLSCALLIVVVSLFSGFIEAFEQSAVQAMGDVVIEPPVKFGSYDKLIRQMEQTEGIRAATATLSGQGLVHLAGGDVRAVQIWGIEPQKRAEVTGFKRALLRQKSASGPVSFEVPDEPDSAGGFVGIGVIAEPNEKTDEYDLQGIEENMIGTQVVLTTGTLIERQGGEVRAKRQVVPFRIADIVFTGVYDLDKRFVYLPISRLQETLYPDQQGLIADQLQVKVAAGRDIPQALEEIKRIWSTFAAAELGWQDYLIKNTKIETSRERQSKYVAEFRKQMGVLLVIFGVVSLSFVLLILCIFYMIVSTRLKDISIIKSCGASSWSVAGLFIGFGGFVGLTGACLGTILGYAITVNINAVERWVGIVFGLDLWKSSVYMFSRIPNQVDWGAAVYIGLFAVLASAIGALIPAIIAARTRPVRILRYE